MVLKCCELWRHINSDVCAECCDRFMEGSHCSPRGLYSCGKQRWSHLLLPVVAIYHHRLSSVWEIKCITLLPYGSMHQRTQVQEMIYSWGELQLCNKMGFCIEGWCPAFNSKHLEGFCCSFIDNILFENWLGLDCKALHHLGCLFDWMDRSFNLTLLRYLSAGLWWSLMTSDSLLYRGWLAARSVFQLFNLCR